MARNAITKHKKPIIEKKTSNEKRFRHLISSKIEKIKKNQRAKRLYS